MTPFVRGYARGETPNPCIRCNGGFRFAELLSFARRIGARGSRRATTRASSSTRGGCSSPAAVDEHKDQSYMLARLDPRTLDRIWFPLGEQTKDETRARGDAAAGLRPRNAPRARRRASSQATTTARSSAGTGLPRRRARSSTRPGRVSATHDGHWQFTPGQRRGLGVSAAEPLYALSTDARTNTVVVGPRALARADARLGAWAALRAG